MINKKALVIAAHPDDEILGCGGTIAKLVKEGYEAFTMILGEGVTSRYNKIKRKMISREIEELKKQVIEANEIIGVKKVFNFDFPDNSFDTVPMLDIIKKIEEIKRDIKPDIIFTHHKKDLNIDHKITAQAVITATRPIKNETVKKIYSFEVLSSTEWEYPMSFSPNVFFDISKTLDKKIEALYCYESEIREYPHPRSIEAVELNAKMWGVKVGLKYAEGFSLIREIQ